MKCENCGNEATFIIRSDCNGVREEHCYCADCARAAGCADALEAPFGSFFSGQDGLFGDFFGDLGGMLAPARSLLRAFDGVGSPFGRMLSAPRERVAFAEPEAYEVPQVEAEAGIPADAGAAIRARRERASLRARLDDAVKAEDYEQAAKLRDELKKLDE